MRASEISQISVPTSIPSLPSNRERHAYSSLLNATVGQSGANEFPDRDSLNPLARARVIYEYRARSVSSSLIAHPRSQKCAQRTPTNIVPNEC